MYKQRITFFLKIREPICFYALNILLKSSRCPFIKIEVSLDNLKILSLQSQFWSILKRARTFYSDNVHTFKDRLIVVLQHHWSAAFILCDLCCFFGINQVLFELCKTESQFLVPWRVNTGTMFNFWVEIICWKMQSSRSASCSKTPPDCCPEQEKKKDEWLQRAWWSPGEEVESPEFSESLWWFSDFSSPKHSPSQLYTYY